MIDRFGKDFRTIDHEDLAKLHYDFATKATGVLRTLCIRNSPQRNALSSGRNLTLGIFNTGLLAAKRNGYGIVGLFEDLDSQRFLGINTPKTNPILEEFETIRRIAAKNSRFRAIVGVTVSTRDTNERVGVRRDLQKLLEHMHKTHNNVLFVFSAGNDNAILEKGNCLRMPSCLGFMPNAITVASMAPVDWTVATAGPPMKLMASSNRGGVIVEIAAPGKDVLSTDVIFLDRYSTQPIYSIRGGTSVSVQFVVSVAAEIWAQMPRATPRGVIERLLATTDSVGVGRRIFRGRDGAVASRILNGSCAISNLRHASVVFRDIYPPTGETFELAGRLDLGDLSQAPNGFVLFSTRLGTKQTIVMCHNIFNLLRIHQTGTPN